MTNPDRSETLTYEGRLDVLLGLVRDHGPHGGTLDEIRVFVPWRTDSHELRAKLIALRNAGKVHYDKQTRRWFV